MTRAGWFRVPFWWGVLVWVCALASVASACLGLWLALARGQDLMLIVGSAASLAFAAPVHEADRRWNPDRR